MIEWKNGDDIEKKTDDDTRAVDIDPGSENIVRPRSVSIVVIEKVIIRRHPLLIPSHPVHHTMKATQGLVLHHDPEERGIDRGLEDAHIRDQERDPSRHPPRRHPSHNLSRVRNNEPMRKNEKSLCLQPLGVTV